MACRIVVKSYRSIGATEFCEAVTRSRYALQSEDSGAGAGVYNGTSVGESACGRARFNPCDLGGLRGGKAKKERKGKSNE